MYGSPHINTVGGQYPLDMVLAEELAVRVSRVQDAMASRGMKALFVSDPRNVRYLTGFESGYVVLSQRTASYFVKEHHLAVNRKRLSVESFPLDVHVLEPGAVKKRLRQLRAKRCCCDDRRSSAMRSLRRQLGLPVSVSDVVESVRPVKTRYEIARLRKAADLAVAGMTRAYEVVDRRRTEQSALADIEYAIRKAGSAAPPFAEGMLLASGAQAANIHARARQKKITRGPVVVDLGACWEGYFSDMTRTIAAGRLTTRERDLMEWVEALELEAVDRISPGVACADVHAFIVGELEKKGFTFLHGAGHGCGLAVHERPNLTAGSKDVFEEDMVFAVEPGVYRAGRFGIRFEDLVWLRKRGPNLLTRRA